MGSYLNFPDVFKMQLGIATISLDGKAQPYTGVEKEDVQWLPMYFIYFKSSFPLVLTPLCNLPFLDLTDMEISSENEVVVMLTKSNL